MSDIRDMLDIARTAWKPRSRKPIWQWAEENIVVDKTSPFPGRFRADTAPWTKEPMENYQDNRIRHIAIRCAAQTSKTQTMLVCGAWSLSEDPGPMMWVLAAQDEAKTFAKTRLLPTWENCPPVAAQLEHLGRTAKTSTEIDFPDSPFIINGANSQSKLQSKPIRWLLLDEVRNYPPGAYDMVVKRVTAFWNSRVVVVSTADVQDDPVDRAFTTGDQRHYYVPCPKCGHKQPLKWSQMKWDTNETTKPAGDWNFDELEKTIRYECVNCGHHIKDDIGARRRMAANGEWRVHNPNAPSNRVSYTWSAILAPWIRFRTLVEEFLQAKALLEMGHIDAMKSFVNERLGEAWTEQYANPVEIKLTDYPLTEPWPHEFLRFMSVDKQKDHYWFVIRLWTRTGSSRLFAEGRLPTWGDVRDVQVGFKVPDRCVVIDSGYEATEVYDQCCRYGWTALKGEDRESFAHWEDGVRFLRPYSELLGGDPGMGTNTQGLRSCPLILWSNPTIKDILHRLRVGKGLPWEVSSEASRDYHQQMRAEAKVRVVNKAGYSQWRWEVIGHRPNHLWDCECMQLVCAIVQDLVPFAVIAEAKNQAKKPPGE